MKSHPLACFLSALLIVTTASRAAAAEELQVETRYSPWAPLDLIASRSDRDELIEYLNRSVPDVPASRTTV